LQEFDFQSGVYHPLVDYETGELETKREFQRWRYNCYRAFKLSVPFAIISRCGNVGDATLLYKHCFDSPSPPSHNTSLQTRYKSHLPAANVCKEDLLQH